MNTLDFDKRMNSTLDYQFFVFIVSNWHYLLYSTSQIHILFHNIFQQYDFL